MCSKIVIGEDSLKNIPEANLVDLRFNPNDTPVYLVTDNNFSRSSVYKLTKNLDEANTFVSTNHFVVLKNHLRLIIEFNDFIESYERCCESRILPKNMSTKLLDAVATDMCTKQEFNARLDRSQWFLIEELDSAVRIEPENIDRYKLFLEGVNPFEDNILKMIIFSYDFVEGSLNQNKVIPLKRYANGLEPFIVNFKVNNKYSPIEMRVHDLLIALALPINLKGTRFISSCLLNIMSNDYTTFVSTTKVLYPAIASEYKTTSSRVERAIRHSINKFWENESALKSFEYLFGYNLEYKPTNSQFLATLCDYLRVEGISRRTFPHIAENA